MAFEFRISHVHLLPSSGTGVLDGNLIVGKVKAGQTVTLVHDGMQIPLKVMGAARSSSGKSKLDGDMSLYVELEQPAMRLASPGDLLVA